MYVLLLSHASQNSMVKKKLLWLKKTNAALNQ